MSGTILDTDGAFRADLAALAAIDVDSDIEFRIVLPRQGIVVQGSRYRLSDIYLPGAPAYEDAVRNSASITNFMLHGEPADLFVKQC